MAQTAATPSFISKFRSYINTQENLEGPIDTAGPGQGLKACGQSLVAIACFAAFAAIPVVVIGGLKWYRAAPGSRDLALGRLLVGSSVGIAGGIWAIAVSCITAGNRMKPAPGTLDPITYAPVKA
jgi:hypothetical protein